jgi:uncharacterized membrane protein
MSIFRKFRQWQFTKQRLEAFSDAVFAIVITLLVLELKVPHIHDPLNSHEVWKSLASVAPIFFSWLVSFFFVAIIWLHHHQILHMATASDYGTMWINNFLLFFICLLPFPTALMGEYHTSPLLVMFWGLTVSATTIMLVWFYHYNTKHYLNDKFERASVRKNVRLSIFAGPLLYFVAALLAWVSVYISFAIYLLVPLLYILPLDRERAGRDGAAGGQGLQ